jgi:hypothetical protein
MGVGEEEEEEEEVLEGDEMCSRMRDCKGVREVGLRVRAGSSRRMER